MKQTDIKTENEIFIILKHVDKPLKIKLRKTKKKIAKDRKVIPEPIDDRKFQE